MGYHEFDAGYTAEEIRREKEEAAEAAWAYRVMMQMDETDKVMNIIRSVHSDLCEPRNMSTMESWIKATFGRLLAQ